MTSDSVYNTSIHINVHRFRSWRLLDEKSVNFCTNVAEFKSLVWENKFYVNRDRYLIFVAPDRKMYAILFGHYRHSNEKGWFRLLRLHDRKNHHLHFSEMGFTGARNNQLNNQFRYKDGLLVDRRRHVVMGTSLLSGENKPDWVVEYELEELFS